MHRYDLELMRGAGDISDQLKLELGRLDRAASVYANSSLGEQFTQFPWTWYDSVTLGN